MPNCPPPCPRNISPLGLFIIILIIIAVIVYILYNTFKPAGRGQPCNTSNNCQNGLICSDMNVCIYNPELGTTTFPGQACYAETECPSNYYCSTVGTCLVQPEAISGQPCKNDQDCGVGYGCSCNRVCRLGEPTYITTSTPQVYTLNANANLYMGLIRPDLTIAFNPEPYTSENVFAYNPNVKVLTRVNTNDFLVYNEQGIIQNESTNPNTSNQFYIREYADEEDLTIFSDLNVNSQCFIDQYGNLTYLYQPTADPSTYFMAVCDDPLHYTNPLSCTDGTPLHLLPIAV